jgi:hypothetical protein
VVLGAFARVPKKAHEDWMQKAVSVDLVPAHLKKNKCHPYKMQLLQHLSEDDPETRMKFCEWVVNKLDGNANFPSGILFTNEAKFYVNG